MTEVNANAGEVECANDRPCDFLTAVYMIISILGVIGNFLVIYIIIVLK